MERTRQIMLIQGGLMTEANTPDSLLAFSQGLAKAVERVSKAVVAVDARPRVATSGIVEREGLIASTNHTVERGEEITIQLADGRRLSGKLVGRDPSTDLAVLRVEADQALGIDPVTTTAHELAVGNLILAVGRIHQGRGVSASFGVVSALGDKWRTWRGGEIERRNWTDVSGLIGFFGGSLLGMG